MKIILYLISASLLFVVLQCKNTEEITTETTKSYYTKTASQSDIDEWIADNLEMVVRVQATVFYRTYRFNAAQQLTQDSLLTHGFSELATATQAQNESSTGTAVVMAESQDGIALLTANHVVDYPDTVWHYQQESPGNKNEVVEAVSVKIKSKFSAFTGDNYGPAKLLIKSDKDDVAVLSSQINMEESLQPGSIQGGNSDELEWADFIYAIGYPKGSKMITSGIVSKTNRLFADGFSTDVSLNPGFSGGLVVAINRKTSNPEWVGMLTSATADVNYLLEPREMNLKEYAPEIPYSGPVFVKRKSSINYGITHAVSIKQIRIFLNENDTTLQENGFNIEDF